MSVPASKSAAGLLHRILTPFTGNNEGKDANEYRHPQLQAAYESVTKLNELYAEKRRLSGLIEAERLKLVDLDEKLAKADADRIEALTEYRVNGDEADKNTAAKKLEECATIRQELNDIQAVADGIAARIGTIETKILSLKSDYRCDIGNFLNGMYVDLAEHYNQVAPQAAEAALQLAALYNVMMRYMAGRSNGFERRIYLPACVPFEGRTLDPILDSDTRKFSDGANARMEAIMAELKNAGFIWRFD